MKEQASYTAPPGHRWGTGSADVVRYLLRDLAQKPAVPVPAPGSPRAPAPRAASALA
jgi:hypothetical protein